MDAIYGCDTCRTTIGRAGCPTHRDSNAYTDEAGAYHFTGSRLVLTHCVHGLDLRLHPRCYLCRPEPIGIYATGGNYPDGAHGYTCGECEWGRDRPRMLADYVAHVNAEHPTGPHRDFGGTDDPKSPCHGGRAPGAGEPMTTECLPECTYCHPAPRTTRRPLTPVDAGSSHPRGVSA